MILLENSDIFFDDSDKDISINAECVPYETEKIIAVNISWTVPVFSYTVEYEWSAESLTEQVKDGSQRWSTDFATITVENRSNQNIGVERSSTISSRQYLPLTAGSRSFHLPFVKSGISTGAPFCLIDSAERQPIQSHAAVS